MAEGRLRRRALRIAPGGARAERVSVAREARVRIVHNAEEVAVLQASPVDLADLAVGHLALEGRVRARADVSEVWARAARGTTTVVVQGSAHAPATPRPRAARGPVLAPAQVRALMKAMMEGSALYRGGGGVHTSALAGPGGIVLAAADVGKVNTLDRLAGQALLQGIATPGLALLTTGRLTGAMAGKALAMGCRVLVSHSGPTSEGLARAEARGCTVVGYARGGAMTVYAGPARIARPEEPRRARRR